MGVYYFHRFNGLWFFYLPGRGKGQTNALSTVLTKMICYCFLLVTLYFLLSNTGYLISKVQFIHQLPVFYIMLFYI